MNFSDQNFSSVCRCSSHKLFIFLSSVPEPLSQFHPNLAQDIGEGDSSFLNEGPDPFPRGDNNEITKVH